MEKVCALRPAVQDPAKMAAAIILETTMAIFTLDGVVEREDGSVEVEPSRRVPPLRLACSCRV